MTRHELISIGSHRVRNDENLMAFYLQEYKEIFGREPNCAGCTFKNDWKKFENHVRLNTNKTITVMADQKKTFELNAKERNTIFTYVEDGRPVRSYGYKMTEDFAEKLLSTGTEKQIAERKKAFKTLPKTSEEKIIEVEGETIKLSEATGKEMTAYAKEKDIDFGDATKVDEKRDVIAKTL